jgi:very-short-patch-repair endonuclease
MRSTDKAALYAQAVRLFGRTADIAGYTAEFVFQPPRRWRFDFAYLPPLRQVAVEVDGGTWSPHGGKHNEDRDREKINAAAMLGWCVLRFTTHQLEQDPARCIDIVEHALRGTMPDYMITLPKRGPAQRRLM